MPGTRPSSSPRASTGPRATPIAVGWRIAHEGRKHFVGTALLDREGAILARSRQIWPEPRNTH